MALLRLNKLEWETELPRWSIGVRMIRNESLAGHYIHFALCLSQLIAILDSGATFD
jgi:hypothetical protein